MVIALSQQSPREGLIKSTRAICERFFATIRRDFAGIIVFISRNHNEIVAEKIRKAPKAHLISASLDIGSSHGADKPGKKLIGPEAAVEAEGKFIEVTLQMLFPRP